LAHDVRCAFVVWHGQRKITFRTQKQAAAEGREKHSIASVGLPGNIAVFLARSRVERDLWVSAIAQEITHHTSTLGEELKLY
jgi:Pleckstrin homology domain